MYHDDPALRDRTQVFRDRRDAGAALAVLLEEFRSSGALVLAIPAGGVPVAVELAGRLNLELDVMPVSKILYPWTTESGFGAVACDGTEWINQPLVRTAGLDQATIAEATAAARDKVRRRMRSLRGDRPVPGLSGRTVILVDDGIAAGSTMRAAISALRRQGAAPIIVAVPTGHGSSLRMLETEADGVYCANVREGGRFAVADAYESWSDVGEDQAAALLAAAETCMREPS
jgi:putative phosphoribosyl transferase